MNNNQERKKTMSAETNYLSRVRKTACSGLRYAASLIAEGKVEEGVQIATQSIDALGRVWKPAPVQTVLPLSKNA